jgi:hypothetical protein
MTPVVLPLFTLTGRAVIPLGFIQNGEPGAGTVK